MRGDIYANRRVREERFRAERVGVMMVLEIDAQERREGKEGWEGVVGIGAEREQERVRVRG